MAGLDLNRRRIFVMPRFQFIFLVYSFSMAAIPLFVLSMSRELMMYFEGTNVYMMVALFTSLTLVFLALVGILLSNRIAGPLYRVTRHLNDLAEGNASGEIRLRDNDYFTELAEAANKVIRKIK